MNMKTDFNNLAFDMINDTFEDLAVEVTFISDSSVYNETDGEMMDFGGDPTVVQAIVGPVFKNKQQGSDFESGDTRLIVPYISLSTEVFLQSDRCIVAGINYIIISKEVDASQSMYFMQLRKDV